ncbi:hypothetical protein [Propionivibrio sp.]|uniref:hypothetical protein n=1 Tax=Propionivibrio sp. TaxID=2212460 RepID=UPI003BF44624
MANKFKTTWFWTSLGTFDGQKGFFIKEKVARVSQRYIDLNEFSQNLQDVYEQLDSAGYDVINVVPISMGTSELCTRQSDGNGSSVGDVGFSITRGAVVVGKRRDG